MNKTLKKINKKVQKIQKNPEKFTEIEVVPGSDISNVLDKLENCNNCYFVFNGIIIPKVKDVSKDELLTYYRYKAYCSSFDKNQTIKEIDETLEVLTEYKKFIQNLNFENLKNKKNLVDFLIKYVEYNDLAVIPYNLLIPHKLFPFLYELGYIPNDLVGDKNIENNCKKEFRWIMGQIVKMLEEYGRIYPYVLPFLKKYKKNCLDKETK